MNYYDNTIMIIRKISGLCKATKVVFYVLFLHFLQDLTENKNTDTMQSGAFFKPSKK